MSQNKSRFQNGVKNRAVFTAIFISAMIIGFQNCGKVSETVTTTNRKITPLASLSGTTNFIIIEQEVLNQLNPSPNGISTDLIEWKINLSTKQITKRYYEVPENDPAGNISTCTFNNANWLTTLQTLLATSQICHTEIINPPGTVCTQALISNKHSSFKVSNVIYDLGYRTNPCSTYDDICGNQKELYLMTLKDFIIDHQYCNN